MKVNNPTINMDYKNHPDFIEYYLAHRCAPDHLYPSERFFIPGLAATINTVLDVGCAGGGFYNVWKHYNPGIQYTGIDHSERLIAAATAKYPGAEFVTGDITKKHPLENRVFDLVCGMGLLSWQPDRTHWEMAVCDMWRMAKKYLLFDVRISSQPEIGYQETQIDPQKKWDKKSATPYQVISVKNLFNLLRCLRPIPLSVSQHGYWGEHSRTAHDIPGRLLFQVVLLEKPEVHP